MIDYHTCHQIHHLHQHEGLSAAQIAAQLQRDEKTVAKWLAR
jgi:DNA-directed RNA polymerase specialized sigma24 family protein